jgi:aldose 1-epimerase
MKKILCTLAAATLLVGCGGNAQKAEQSALNLMKAEDFTATIDGKQVGLYTLTNGTITMQVTNFGGRVVSLWTPDRDGNMEDIVLGYDKLDRYVNNTGERFLGAPVGRVANRIAGGQMTVEGKEYHLEVNNGPNHLHGGTKNFSNRLWESCVEYNRVIFTLVSEDGDCGYPGEVTAQVVYDFDDENNLEITLMAKSDATTPVNLTNHTYWNLAGENSGTILDHTLTLNCSKALEMNAVQIPTGKLLDVAGTPQDFTTARRLGDDIASEFNHIRDFRGYDHFFVVDGWQKNILGEVGKLVDPKSGRMVEILSSQPGCMVYTGNWLSGGCPVTKSGERYCDYAGVAIECQGYPDAVNQPDFPTILLHEGELYCQKIVFRLRTA